MAEAIVREWIADYKVNQFLLPLSLRVFQFAIFKEIKFQM